ncbi:MAG: hypothetical protein JWO38_3353 [Gemmataceae bacterium]|nr:hypothetical protein [Gemmataceae bacterium]
MRLAGSLTAAMIARTRGQVSTRPRPVCRRRDRAAGVVLSLLVSVVALQVAFHYPLAAVFPQARDVEYGKKLTRLRKVAAARPPDRPLVVAFGSSLTAMGFCPETLPGQTGTGPGRPLCYNFAMNSSGVVVQLLCLRRLLAEGIRPDLVLIEFSPYFLHLPHNLVNDGEFIPPARARQGDFAVLDRYHPAPARFRADWRGCQLFPWVSYRNNLQLWAAPDAVSKARRVDHLWRHTDRWGWEFLPEAIARLGCYYLYPEPCQFLRDYWYKMTGEPTHPGMEAAFCELVDLCNLEGLRHVVVWVPESSFIRTSYHPDGTWRVAAFIERLRTTHRAEVVDARDWLTDPEFMDGHHPNPAGAHAYTTRLDREVLWKYVPRPPGKGSDGPIP